LETLLYYFIGHVLQVDFTDDALGVVDQDIYRSKCLGGGGYSSVSFRSDRNVAADCNGAPAARLDPSPLTQRYR